MGHYDGAINIPLGTLRDRMGDLPREKEILSYCSVGQRSYYASRALRLHGFEAKNISGGMTTYLAQKSLQSP
jgi:rhodanese-related sulfurtransferase